jgi:NADPH:quinone reductase
MKQQLPTTMLAAQLDAVGEPLVARQIPVPKPRKGEVLVKMAASPINPSDLAFMMGGYGFKEGLPVTPGNEGSGVVVAAGAGFMSRRLLGKRVSCFARPGLGGAWAEYMLTNASYCIPVGKKISMEQAATSLINPLTALAFMDIVRRKKYPAFVNTAANSALGRMLVRLGKRQGVPLINVVRNEAQVKALKELGADHILDSSAPGFDEQLKTLCHQLKATLLLDAVGGPLLGQLLLAAPHGSDILSYGRLSAEPCVIEPGALILQKKRIMGFFLTDWIKKRNLLQIMGDIRRVQNMLHADMATEIKARMPIASVNEALKQYQEKMSGGKILLTSA